MSPVVRLDLSEAQSFGPIPDGTYPGTVVSINGPVKGPNSQYFKARCKITDGDYEGRVFIQNLPINGAGAGIFASFVSACTGEEIDVDELDDLEIDTDELVGAEIGLVMKQQEYPEGSGEFRSQIQRVIPAE